MSENRTYPVKDAAVTLQASKDYVAKLNRNLAAGKEAFSSGGYSLFEGYKPETIRKEAIIVLELDRPSQDAVINRVARPLQTLASKYDIEGIYTGGNDLPPHVTMEMARTNLSLPKFDEAMAALLSDSSHLAMLSSILSGLQFHHNTLVMAPNSYICAGDFNAEQGAAFRAKRLMEEMMRRSAQEITEGPEIGTLAPPYRYDDIFHTSVSRLVAKKSPSEALLTFAAEAEATVGRELRRQPLSVRVERVYAGTSLDFVRENAPHLLKSA